MNSQAIRITAVPRRGHPVSGLQAMHFARHFGDHVWALPAEGEPVGDYDGVRFFMLDKTIWKQFLGVRAVRIAFFLWMSLRATLLPRKLFLVHSFVFAAPLWLLRRRYAIFIHGTDRRFLDHKWAQAVARAALGVFGVGFSVDANGVVVHEIPNIFIAKAALPPADRGYDVLFVLRNAPVKNPLFPIDLARELGRTLQLRIGVVGVAVDELPADRRVELEALHRDGIIIDYLGRQPLDVVMGLMRASRVLMLPSFSEGIPKVVLEAMSQGMSVVINRDLQLPEDILAHVHAVPLDDWEGLARLLHAQTSQSGSERNVNFARSYLERSQAVLLSVYDDIYLRFRRSSPDST
jgi:hypothetical protein